MTSLTPKVNTLQASDSTEKERAGRLQAKNQTMKALLSEKYRIKNMYTEAVLGSKITTLTSNKRVGDLGNQSTTMSAIDNPKAAAPSGKPVCYGSQVVFITARSAITMDSGKVVTIRN